MNTDHELYTSGTSLVGLYKCRHCGNLFPLDFQVNLPHRPEHFYKCSVREEKQLALFKEAHDWGYRQGLLSSAVGSPVQIDPLQRSFNVFKKAKLLPVLR